MPMWRNWQTHMTQNHAGNHVGSSPTIGTKISLQKLNFHKKLKSRFSQFLFFISKALAITCAESCFELLSKWAYIFAVVEKLECPNHYCISFIGILLQKIEKLEEELNTYKKNNADKNWFISSGQFPTCPVFLHKKKDMWFLLHIPCVATMNGYFT